MRETVVAASAVSEAGLPARVRGALGGLANGAREGLLALSVGVGLGVLAELMEEEVTDVVGPRGPPRPRRECCAPRNARRRSRRCRGCSSNAPASRWAS